MEGIVITSDGSAYTREGNAYAGWGFTVSNPHADSQTDLHGPVVTSPSSNEYLGAGRLSNNTGELTELIWALWYIVALAPAECHIQYDSKYAANMTRGSWRPQTNIKLVIAARNALEAASRRTTITWSHVYGHLGNTLNERADQLAKCGAQANHLQSSDVAGVVPMLAAHGASSARLSW